MGITPPHCLQVEWLLLAVVGFGLVRDGNSPSVVGASRPRADDGGDFAEHVQDNKHSMGEGTTLDIEQIVVGRCWNYQHGVTDSNGAPPPSQVDCDNAVWPAFVGAFAYKEPCNTPPDAYRNFTLMMTVSLPKNGTIFWSGTKSLAMAYSELSGGTMFSLETTFLGYTVNNLAWCGASTGGVEGINYDRCPAYGDSACPSPVAQVFWGAASAEFARQARGSVTVFLNGSDSNGAFRNTSFFATMELPNLNVSRVNTVNIIVVHNLDGKTIDTCDTGTILTLKERIVTRGLKWTCEDDPRLATLVRCTENPVSEK